MNKFKMSLLMLGALLIPLPGRAAGNSTAVPAKSPHSLVLEFNFCLYYRWDCELPIKKIQRIGKNKKSNASELLISQLMEAKYWELNKNMEKMSLALNKSREIVAKYGEDRFHPLLLAATFHANAEFWVQTGQPQLAVFGYLKASQLYPSVKEYETIYNPGVLATAGGILTANGLHKEALQVLNRAMKLKPEGSKNPDKVWALIHTNTSSAWFGLGKLKKALEQDRKAVAAIRELDKEPFALAMALHNMSITLMALEMEEEALSVLEECLKLTEHPDLQQTAILPPMLLTMSQIYLDQNKPHKALETLYKLKNLPKTGGAPLKKGLSRDIEQMIKKAKKALHK